MGTIFIDNNRTSKNAGFTIVELLIVVVVIAILAAITIVSYNGITTRAENTRTIDAVVTYSTALASYAALNGEYPKASGLSDGNGTICLGSDTCNVVSGSVPANSYTCYQGGAAPLNYDTKSKYEPFNTELKTVISALPNVDYQAYNCNGATLRGIFFYRYLDATPYLLYFLKGSQTCKSVGTLTEMVSLPPFNAGPLSTVTLCGGELPAKG
jgi:prepilin-type N-terminal cleavage/methylation domain-containing protein